MALDSGSFTAGQLTFIEKLAGDTGLDPGVIAAWCYAEENGSAAQARQASNSHNWLNIGFFDSGPGTITQNSAFSDPTTAADRTASFLQGTWGGASGGIRGILLTVGKPASVQIADIQSSGWATSGYPTLPQIYGSLSGALKTQLGAGTAGGGTFGAGGTGTPGNPTSLWTVGDASNPDQDFYTTINQYGMNAQWYVFSDAERLFVADGIKLMAQQPAAIISRLDPNVTHLELTWDNTAFQYTHTHTHKARIQRRTSLAKVTSPTEATVNIICDIDRFRAGDTAVLALCGPGDGVWLIGDEERDFFQPISELTLVQAMQPINASTGLTGGPNFLTGATASAAASGTVMSAMISEAQTITTRDYPYVWGGGHAQAGTPSGGGFDCSGAVAAVLAAGGLWKLGSSVPSDSGVIAQLQSENKIVPGQGTGNPECTLWDKPGVHIFMRLNGQYFGTSDGENGNHSQPHGGAGWLNDSHSDANDPAFRAYHVPANILGQQAGG